MKANFKPMVATVVGTLLFGATQASMADSIDDLLKTLHDNGVLNEQEYDHVNSRRDEEKIQKRSEVKASFKDGISFESADGGTKFSVSGRGQADYRTFGARTTGADTWLIRRAYLGAKGVIYNDISYEVTGNFAELKGTSSSGSTTGLHLDVAYINFGWWKEAQLRVGQFVMPGNLDQMSSDLYSDFQERSMGAAMAMDKDTGMMLWGEPFNGVYYQAAYSTGMGKNSQSVNDPTIPKDREGQTYAGRVAVNFAPILDRKDMILQVGASATTGSNIAAGVISSLKTEAQTNTFFSTSATAGRKNRYGLEGVLAYGPVKLQTEYYGTEYSGGTLGANSPAIDSWYADLNWMVTGENYADAWSGGLAGRMKPKSNFVHPFQGSGFGAVELGLRYSKVDASDFALSGVAGAMANVTTTDATHMVTNKADAWTAGAKWILNPNTRVMLTYIHTSFDTPVMPVEGTTGVSNEDALFTRFQIDF
jgi:phosphate-selective porin OprO/OprP